MFHRRKDPANRCGHDSPPAPPAAKAGPGSPNMPRSILDAPATPIQPKPQGRDKFPDPWPNGDMHNGAGPGLVRLYPMKFVKNRACSGYGGPVGHGDFLLAAYERRKISLPRAASATARPYQPEQRHRLRHAFQFIGAALLGDEQTSDLALHRRC